MAYLPTQPHPPKGLEQCCFIKEIEMLRTYVIEREISGVGQLTPVQIGEAARTSNAALGKIDGVQWQQSYVTRDKTFCIYLAENEERILEHAELSGFPATKITLVSEIIDPTTEGQCEMATPRLA
jgi:hypothetical protein